MCATGKIDETLGLVQNSQRTGDIWEKSCSSMATNWENKSSKGKIRTIHISPRVSSHEWQTAASCNRTKLIAPTS